MKPSTRALVFRLLTLLAAVFGSWLGANHAGAPHAPAIEHHLTAR